MVNKEDQTQHLILTHIVEMRGELSTVIQSQKSMDKHNDRIKSLEDTRMWVYGCFTTISAVAGSLYIYVVDKIEEIKAVVSHVKG